MGFQRKSHIKSVFLGQNKYIYGRSKNHMDTISTLLESGALRMRLNVSTRAQTKMVTFFSDSWITCF
jgi:hypothetical protein